MQKKGIVFLVGAGPGDPGLITVRGRSLLARADVVIYDRLANPELLDEVPTNAERIFAGKQPGNHSLSQNEINVLLVEKATEGKHVVRLKGGDPFVFGRGGEEAQALTEAGIPFEVVPGITSAIAAPAYAGIPVTHRGVAGSFMVITGHRRKEVGEAEDDDILGFNWEALAEIDTLVFLMGVSTLPMITQQLIQAGRPPETPVAMIYRGTWPQQKVITGNLSDIAERAKIEKIHPPAVTVVGEVVKLRDKVRWFDNRPLFGKKVVVTRAKDQAGQLSSQLRALGADPIEFPTIAIEPPETWQLLDNAIKNLPDYDWVIFTSVNGVRYFWERLRKAGKDSRSLGAAKIAAIGPATAESLSQNGIVPDLVPEEFVSEALLNQILPVSGQKILLPRADIARPKLAEGLRQGGALVNEITAYCTVLGSKEMTLQMKKFIKKEEIDVITFTSSSTVRNFFEILGPSLRIPDSTNIACIGPITADTARELGLPVHIIAEEYTIKGLVDSLVKHFTR